MYIVEKILEKKIEEGQTLYKIKWKNWPMSSCTWEPVENLENITEMIAKFENRDLEPKEGQKKGAGRPKGSKKEKPIEAPKKRGRPKGYKKTTKSFLQDVITLTEKETDDMEVHMVEEKPEVTMTYSEEPFPQEENPPDNILEPIKTFQEIVSFDVPEKIMSAKKVNEQILFLCRFKERNDGSRLEDSYVDCLTMETYFSNLLYNFYKSQIFAAN
jgi:hypothetical protein